MSDTKLHDEIIVIARDWAKQYGVGEEKARALVDRIWPAIEKVISITPDVSGEGKPSGPTKE
jgi:hypothetical protein